MIVSNINGIKVLTPEKSEDSITNMNNDFYSQEVWLGVNDSETNYQEVLTPVETVTDIYN